MSTFSRHVFAVALLLAACAKSNQSTTGGPGSSSSASTSTGTGTGGSGGLGSATIALPQFVHGAARVDTTELTTIPIVVTVTAGTPDAVNVTVDGSTTAATQDGARFVALLDTTTLAPGTHPVTVDAIAGGVTVASTKVTLTADVGSLQFTSFATAGPAYGSHLVRDASADAIDATWVSVATGKHALYLNQLDGAFARLWPTDVVLNDPADEPLNGYTAFGPKGIGVVYRVAKPADSHWSVKMRVVDAAGKETVPAMNLTGTDSAFAMQQAAADAGGFSAAWLHITAPTAGNPSPPLEVRFARWDVAAQKLLGPVTLDSDQPQATGSTQGPQTLEPLAEMGMACNATKCLVTYTRDEYNALVQLNIPKLFVAPVDIASGALVSKPKAVSNADWDTQMFGHQIIALADGTFELVYTANDTVAAVTPKSPCDNSLERDLLFHVAFDASGQEVSKPKPIFDNEGSREFPRVAVHPSGFALLWEDQRSECNPAGHIRMTANIGAPDLASLLNPYAELPGSIGLPPEAPSVTVAGTNAEVIWSDDRHGGGVLNPKPELYLDTYWSK